MENLQVTLDSVRQDTVSALGKDLYQIYLYGSCARGDDNLDSDIDIMIIVDADDEDHYANKIDAITGDICTKYAVLLSTQITTKNNWLKKQSYLPFYQSILKEGKLIYDKQG